MNKKITGAVFFAAAVFLLCSCPAKAQNNSAGDSLAKAFTAANLRLFSEKVTPRDFSLPTPEGKTISLSDLKGKVVFLNFWATWCGPCRAEMPSMETLFRQYREKGLEILAVNCGEGQADVQNFMNSNDLSFTAVLDQNGKVSGPLGIRAIPTTYLLDREGKILSMVVGSIDWDTPGIRAALEILLD